MATLQNIGVLKYRDKDGNWHPLPVVVQDADGGVSTISGKGAPTSATQGEVNQLYRDEDTQKLYICTATDGGYTWAAVSGGSVDVDATLTKAGYAADAKAAGDAIAQKLDATALPTAVNNALAQAKASGEFDGAKGEKGDPGAPGIRGEKGADGKDGAGMDVTGAKVGQIAKITAVDSAGKPTEWAPVDMPSGGTYTLPIASPAVLGGVKPIAKTDAMTQGVGVDAAGALWTAVGGSGGGFPKFETIYEHTVTADETTNIVLFTITNTNVPNLGDYNVFVCEIKFAEETPLTKWVRMKINNERISQICGSSASTSKIYSCSVNRLFGHWIGSSVYNVNEDGKHIPAVIVPSINCYALEHDNDATSIQIGSYNSDFGLVEGTILRIYAAK